MTKDSSKLSYALLNYYTKLYTDKYGRKPVVNIYKEKWAMNDVIESVGYDRAKELLDYYASLQKYMLTAIFGVTLIGTLFFAEQKSVQYGGGFSYFNFFFY